MLFSPRDFFNLFFSELDRFSIPYVVLHSYAELPGKIDSDIDYAVLNRDLPRLAGIQRRLAESCGAVLAHTIEAHIDALYTVVIDPANPTQFLQLDACGHYVERDRRLLTDAELLESRQKYNRFYVPAPEVEFAYLLAKALAKGTNLAPRLTRLRELVQLNPSAAQAKFAKLTGETGSIENWLNRPVEDWSALRNAMLNRHRPRLGDRFREGLRRIRRIVEPKGFHITLIGGSAESRRALRDQAGPLLQKSIFRRQVNHDFAASSAAHGSEIPLCCGTAWLWQFTRQYFRKLYPAKVRNELIFSEGGADDLVRDPSKYGLSEAGRFTRLLAPLLPKADLTVFMPKASDAALETSTLPENTNHVLILPPALPVELQVREVLGSAILLLQKREEEEPFLTVYGP